VQASAHPPETQYGAVIGQFAFVVQAFCGGLGWQAPVTHMKPVEHAISAEQAGTH
jgi:hypothetical protein